MHTISLISGLIGSWFYLEVYQNQNLSLLDIESDFHLLVAAIAITAMLRVVFFMFSKKFRTALRALFAWGMKPFLAHILETESSQ